MELASLLLATLFVAPPIRAEPDPEPGMRRDAYGDALPFGAVARYGTLRYRAGYAGCVAFSRDGKTVISAGGNNQLCFWDTNDGKLLRQYEAFSAPNHQFAISPDDKLVVTGNNNEPDAILRHLETGKVIRRLKGLKYSPGILRFSPNSKFIAGAGTGAVVIWDVATGKQLARLQMGRFGRDWQPAVLALGFSPDGKYLAVGGHEAMLYEVGGWKHIGTLKGHSERIRSIAFTPDNRKVITKAEDQTLRVWSLATQKEIRRVEDTWGYFLVLRDGKTAIWNDKEGRVRAWDLETGRSVHRFTAKHFASSSAFSADETRVVGFTFSAVVVHDARTGKCLTPMPVPDYPPELIAFAPDGKHLAIVYAWPNSGPTEVRLWRVGAEETVLQPKWSVKLPLAVRVSEGRNVFLFGSTGLGSGPELNFEHWDVTAGKKTSKFPKGGYASRMPITKKGNVYAALGKELVEWDPAANRIVGRIATEFEHGYPLLSADERVLLASCAEDTKTWSTITGKELSRFVRERDDNILALSADGKHFITGGEKRSGLRDTRTGALLLDFDQKQVRSAAFSPDDRLLAVADVTGAFQLWDCQTRKRLRRVVGHRDFVRTLLFSPDSRYLASVSSDTTILVWDVRKLAPGGK